MPSLRMLKDIGNFPIRLFCATSQESVPEKAKTVNGPFPRFAKKKSFQRHKTRSSEGINKNVIFSPTRGRRSHFEQNNRRISLIRNRGRRFEVARSSR